MLQIKFTEESQLLYRRGRCRNSLGTEWNICPVSEVTVRWSFILCFPGCESIQLWRPSLRRLSGKTVLLFFFYCRWNGFFKIRPLEMNTAQHTQLRFSLPLLFLFIFLFSSHHQQQQHSHSWIINMEMSAVNSPQTNALFYISCIYSFHNCPHFLSFFFSLHLGTRCLICLIMYVSVSLSESNCNKSGWIWAEKKTVRSAQLVILERQALVSHVSAANMNRLLGSALCPRPTGFPPQSRTSYLKNRSMKWIPAAAFTTMRRTGCKNNQWKTPAALSPDISVCTGLWFLASSHKYFLLGGILS